MAVRQLPRRPSLEYLRNESRELQRGTRRGDSEALAFLAEHHPRGRADTLTRMQLAVARSYGFAELAEAARARRDDQPVLLATRRGRSPMTRISTWSNGSWRCVPDVHRCRRPPTTPRRPRPCSMRIPRSPPPSVHAMAAANEADAMRAAIATDPTLVERPGGPHRWVPLLYAAYARIPGRSTLEAAHVLLDAGADPNAGSLWMARTRSRP